MKGSCSARINRNVQVLLMFIFFLQYIDVHNQLIFIAYDDFSLKERTGF